MPDFLQTNLGLFLIFKYGHRNKFLGWKLIINTIRIFFKTHLFYVWNMWRHNFRMTPKPSSSYVGMPLIIKFHHDSQYFLTVNSDLYESKILRISRII